MAFGLLGNVATIVKDQDYELYKAPTGVKAVGTVVISRIGFSNNNSLLVLITSSNLSASALLASPSNTSLYGVLFSGLISAATTASETLPLMIGGVVVGPDQRIVVVQENIPPTDTMLVTFNGVEESV